MGTVIDWNEGGKHDKTKNKGLVLSFYAFKFKWKFLCFRGLREDTVVKSSKYISKENNFWWHSSEYEATFLKFSGKIENEARFGFETSHFKHKYIFAIIGLCNPKKFPSHIVELMLSCSEHNKLRNL